MNNKTNVSRRRFVKTGVLTAVTITSAGALSSCATKNQKWEKENPFPLFKRTNFKPENGVAGLLFSQVGYEPGFPVRIILRLRGKDNLPEST
ncbi:MAG: hypothetical protein WC341_17560, partial [Bacteroidales bacterium]